MCTNMPCFYVHFVFDFVVNCVCFCALEMKKSTKRVRGNDAWQCSHAKTTSLGALALVYTAAAAAAFFLFNEKNGIFASVNWRSFEAMQANSDQIHMQKSNFVFRFSASAYSAPSPCAIQEAQKKEYHLLHRPPRSSAAHILL